MDKKRGLRTDCISTLEGEKDKYTSLVTTEERLRYWIEDYLKEEGYTRVKRVAKRVSSQLYHLIELNY